MKLQVPLVGDAQERVQEAAVADEHLGRLDLPLAEILEPRRQLPKHEDAGQEIEIAATVDSLTASARASSAPFQVWA